jgi:hypothetical protein
MCRTSGEKTYKAPLLPYAFVVIYLYSHPSSTASLCIRRYWYCFYVPNVRRTTYKAPQLPYASVVTGIHTHALPPPYASVDIIIDFLCQMTYKMSAERLIKKSSKLPRNMATSTVTATLYLTAYDLGTLDTLQIFLQIK